MTMRVHCITSLTCAVGVFGALILGLCWFRSNDHRWCTGKKDTTGDSLPWANRGYGYIRTRQDCEKYAAQLKGLPWPDNQGIIVERITDKCIDHDAGSGDPSPFQCQHMAKHAGCEAAQKGGLFQHVPKWKGPNETLRSLRCEHTCNMCATTDPKNAPLGYCVVEQDGADTSTQRLVFYTDKDGEQPGRYYRGSNWTAMCKVRECNSLQQVKGNGATKLARGQFPDSNADAQCEPNPAQLASWARSEEEAYLIFYVTSGIIAAVFFAMSIWLVTRRTRERFYTKKAEWKMKAIQLFGALLLSIRAFDFMSDWGFWDLAVQTPRFQYLCKKDGFSHSAYSDASLAFCVIASVLFIPDIYFFYERYAATEGDRRPSPASLLSQKLVVVCEDIPQLFLQAQYLYIVTTANDNHGIDPGQNARLSSVPSTPPPPPSLSFYLSECAN